MFFPLVIPLNSMSAISLPAGVNSNFRFWGDGITPYVYKAKGAYLWDVDGKKYIDYRMAFGPIILGHSYDEVDQKVIEEIKRLKFSLESILLDVKFMIEQDMIPNHILDDFVYQRALELMSPEFLKVFNND